MKEGAEGGGVTERAGVSRQVLPSLWAIRYEVRRLLQASLALHPPATAQQQQQVRCRCAALGAEGSRSLWVAQGRRWRVEACGWGEG